MEFQNKINFIGFFCIFVIFVSVIILFFPSMNIKIDIQTLIYLCFSGIIGLFCLAIVISILYYLFIDPFISGIFWEFMRIIILLFFSWYFIIHLCIYFIKNRNNLISSEFVKGFLDPNKCFQSSPFCIGLLIFGNLDRTTDMKSSWNIFYLGDKIQMFVKWIRDKLMNSKNKYII